MASQIVKSIRNIFVFAFFVYTVHSSNINVTLKEYDRNNANTSCSSDLLVDDNFNIFGYTNYTQFEDEAHVKLIVFNGKKDPINIDERLLKMCTGINLTKQLTCHHQANHINISMYINASIQFSGSLLQLQVKDNNKAYNSAKIQLPFMYDPKNIKMTIGDKPVKDNFTVLYVPDNVTEIKVCCQESPKPCFAVISINNTSEINNRSDCVSYKPDHRQTQNIHIGYIVCKKEFINRYEIQLKFDNKAITTEAPFSTTQQKGIVETNQSGLSPIAKTFIIIGFFIVALGITILLLYKNLEILMKLRCCCKTLSMTL